MLELAFQLVQSCRRTLRVARRVNTCVVCLDYALKVANLLPKFARRDTNTLYRIAENAPALPVVGSQACHKLATLARNLNEIGFHTIELRPKVVIRVNKIIQPLALNFEGHPAEGVRSRGHALSSGVQEARQATRAPPNQKRRKWAERILYAAQGSMILAKLIRLELEQVSKSHHRHSNSHTHPLLCLSDSESPSPSCRALL